MTLSVALVRPEIPPNTGNVARLCAANNVPMHIVGRPMFRLDDRAVRRAGLDYWPHVVLRRHAEMQDLERALGGARMLFFSARQGISYAKWEFHPDDCLVFGPEATGLPRELLGANHDRCLTIPMLNPHVRSLNLATAVGIVLYEALRQTNVLDAYRSGQGVD